MQSVFTEAIMYHAANGITNPVRRSSMGLSDEPEIGVPALPLVIGTGAVPIEDVPGAPAASLFCRYRRTKKQDEEVHDA